MKIKIIVIGKLKEKYWTDASAEYLKRLKPYCDVEIVELKESRLQGTGQALEEQVKVEEGHAILDYLAKTYSKGGSASSSLYLVTLEIQGKKFSSEQLAEKINALTSKEGKSDIAFVIGGSLGLSDEVSRAADLHLSFSDMTFPHQMMRVILLEQIYRSFKIIRGETYHK